MKFLQDIRTTVELLLILGFVKKLIRNQNQVNRVMQDISNFGKTTEATILILQGKEPEKGR